jgi:hypothetical protein
MMPAYVVQPRKPSYFDIWGGGGRPASIETVTVSGMTQDERSKSMYSSAFS